MGTVNELCKCGHVMSFHENAIVCTVISCPCEKFEGAGTYKIPGVKDQTLKKDAGKVPMELLPTGPLVEIAKVLGFGAKKYAPDGWRAGMDWRRVYGAILRHLAAWEQGEDQDPETGLDHLAHAATEVLFLIEYAKRGLGNDDRFRPPAK